MKPLADLAQEAFDAEVSRRASLLAAVNFPTGILTGLLAALTAGIYSLVWPFDFLSWSALVASLLALVPIATSGAYIARSLVAHEYQYPANVADLKNWHAQLIAAGLTPAAADAQLDSFLTEEYAKCAGHNARRNDIRSFQLYRASSWMIASVLAVALAAVPLSLARLLRSVAKPELPTTGPVQIVTQEQPHGRDEARGNEARGRPCSVAAAAPHASHPRKHRPAAAAISHRLYRSPSAMMWSNTAGCSGLAKAQP